MRILPLAPLGLSLLLAACGGGSGAPSGGGALLKGSVVAVNGQSTNVAGVSVRSASTGASDMSGADGTFDLGSVPGGIEVLHVHTEHGVEIEIEVEVHDGDEVEIRISVHDDHVDRVNEDHCDDDGSHSENRTRLTALEAGLEGHVRVRKDEDGDQGFDIEAENLAAGRLVDMVVIDPTTGAEELLARVTADDHGEAELELRSSDGQRLPFNVADVADLADFRVEVRDASTGLVILEGEVPALGSLPDCGEHASDDDSDDASDDASDDDSDDDSGDDDMSGEAHLVNQGLVSGTGEIELRSRPACGEEQIEIQVHGTDAVGVLEAWLEDPANPGTLVLVGVLSPEDDGLEFERDTEDGETLPFGVGSVSDLVGLAVEVRRASDGAILFTGTTPPVRLD